MFLDVEVVGKSKADDITSLRSPIKAISTIHSQTMKLSFKETFTFSREFSVLVKHLQLQVYLTCWP